MMDQEVLQSYDVDLLEDGELTDSSGGAASHVEEDDVDVYTPLQRPTTLTSATVVAPAKAKSDDTVVTLSTVGGSSCEQMQEQQTLEDDNDTNGDSSSDSSSGESTYNCLKKLSDPGGIGKSQRKKKKQIRRTVMVRMEPTDTQQDKQRARFKKYDIWTASLQEDTLTENMRGIDVTKSGRNDRNVENYDFSLRYRLNGENSLKRRLSNSTDDISDNEYHQPAKRGRATSGAGGGSAEYGPRKSAKSRLGPHRSRQRGRRGSSPTSGSDNSYEPRHILDLDEAQGRDPLDVAREMANKLCEEKDELMVRIVEVLGTDLPADIYKETQRIEADGGMMIKNRKRRRTPGGVFLFLLKEDARLTAEQQKQIFADDRQNTNKWRKELKAQSRDRKVEELKKRLNKQQDLPVLSTRKEHFLLGSELNLDTQPANLSNPPPSPVGQEHSPEYKTHAINHVQDVVGSPEKPSTSASALAALVSPSKDLVSYDDDFLDVNCGEMDFF